MILYCGLMSGTSLDGIDTAFAEIEVLDASPNAPRFAVRFAASGFTPYPNALKARLQPLRHGEAVSIAEVCALHYELAELYAEAVVKTALENGIALSDIAGVGLHGQTVWHAPPSSSTATSSTLQLGQPAVLAERLGIPIVSDFRARDIAAGGEGAPLVPFADYALLASPSETRVMLNLGGVANVTYLEAGGDLDQIIAFDTGPGNLVIDGAARALLGTECDTNGAIAAQGTNNSGLLAELLTLPYFALAPPKSTGAELFDNRYIADFLARAASLAPEETLATATELTVRTIVGALQNFLPRLPQRIIVGGGGARNQTLLRGLQTALPTIIFDTHEAHGIPSDAKEALAFALLACATLHHIPANVPSATGARGRRVLGSVIYP